MSKDEIAGDARKELRLALGLALFASLAFYFSVSGGNAVFDYTSRIALALLHGHLGLTSAPPSWLNEMVPRDGSYYSVFPFGAVLSVMPVALFQEMAGIQDFPGRILAALIAGLCTYFFFQLSRLEGGSVGRRILLALCPMFATWAWCNLGFAGAWQIAIGFAVLGEVAALYFTLVRPRPFIAGTFFALAFGNRTELLLALPIYFYLWLRPAGTTFDEMKKRLRQNAPIIARFLIVPTLLALLTAAYNLARFHSVFEFGYNQIPNLQQEPWYQHGLFSVHAIPWNIHTMLFEGFESISDFPYIRPHAFGCSIFLASPFLFLLFREGGKYKSAAWSAIGLLTFALWCHGNPGGWQFSYRYGLILLPWMYLLFAGNGPAKITAIEVSLFIVSVAINAIATYQFLWTEQIHP